MLYNIDDSSIFCGSNLTLGKDTHYTMPFVREMEMSWGQNIDIWGHNWWSKSDSATYP